jgi:hypothetical protein
MICFIIYLATALICAGSFKFVRSELTEEEVLFIGFMWPVMLIFYMFVLTISVIRYIVESIENNFEE